MHALLLLLTALFSVHAVDILSHSPHIVFSDASTTNTLSLSGYNLTGISSITLGGNISCSPQTANYSASTEPCIIQYTRDTACQGIGSQYSLVLPTACEVNQQPCFNVSDAYSNCTILNKPTDQCSQISCYYPTDDVCLLFTYTDTPYKLLGGYVGTSCDDYSVCSNSYTCIPNNPPNTCKWDISCHFSNLALLHNDLTLALSNGTNITQRSAVTAVPKPLPTSLSTAACVSPYETWFAASPGTPITVNYTLPLTSLNATVLYLCNDVDYLVNFTMVNAVPAGTALGAGSVIECEIQLTYETYNWTAILRGYMLLIEYLPLPVLFSLCPAEILADIATDVVIQGSLFTNTSLLTCTFGGQPMPVRFIAVGTVVCTVFSANQTTTFVPLSISNDGVSFATTPLQLKITGGCGSIKPNSVPSGSECVCLPGYQDMGGFCQLCPDGTYQPNYAQQSCIPCDASEDTGGTLGSTTLHACACKVGKYRAKPTDSFCSPCPLGLDCGINGTVSVLPGYWRATADSVILTSCSSLASCPGGQGAGNKLCSKGYKGPLCSICKVGYGQLDGACLACPSKGLNGFVVFVMFSVGLFVVLMLVKTTTRQAVVGDHMGVTIKITFSYLQLLYYEGKLAANWSHQSNQFFASMIPITLSPSFLSIQCATHFGFYKNITLMMVLPLIIIVATAAAYIFYYVYKKSTSKRDTIFWFDVWMDCEGAILVLLYMAHPTISQDIIRSFQCVGVPGTGTSFMKDDMRVDCSSPSYHRYVVVASLYLVFYIAGFLLFILRRMITNKDAVKKVNNGASLGEANTLIFFVRGYQNRTYLWEFLVIGRKLGVVIVNSLFPIQIQLVWAAIIVACSLSVTTTNMPYKSILVNRLEIMSLTALVFTIVLGFHGQLMVHPDQEAIFVLLVLVNTLVATIMIMAVFRTMQPMIRALMDRLAEWLSIKRQALAPRPHEFGESSIKMNTLPANYKNRYDVAQAQHAPQPQEQDEIEL